MGDIQSVIFDFDGVLADTERLHLSAFQQVFAPRGWPLGEREYFDRYLGYDDVGLVVAYARDRALGLEDTEVEAVVAEKGVVFGQHLMAGAVLYPGARDTVARMAREFSVGIASGALHGEIVSVLRAADLLSFFPVIVAADDVQRSKPWPEPYLAAAAGLGVSPNVCVAIEDSLGGLRSARTAGMLTIAVTTTTPRESLAGAADAIITTVHDLTAELIRAVGATRQIRS